MRKFLILFGIIFCFVASTHLVYADTNVCNKGCQVNEECGQGYRCYVGVCRALACPSSQTCGCAPVTPAPTVQAQTQSKVTVTPVPKVTPVASASAKLKKSPKTGGSVPQVFVFAVTLAVLGLLLRGMAAESL